MPQSDDLDLMERLDDPDATGQDGSPPDSAFRTDVLRGLAQRQKVIPARWFYDFAGSQLFEQITTLPEYYPTRVEIALLEAHGHDVAQAVGSGRVVVEFGSGSSTKTPLLLKEVAPAAYVPIDISGAFLRQCSEALAKKFPGLKILPIEADFMAPVDLPAGVGGQAMLGFFPGSTIGNMVPAQAVDLLRSMRETLGQGAWLLIGLDRVKDEGRLVAAYDDAQGITARFNLNVLERINRELDGDVPVHLFHHVARWNALASRMEMHLEAQDDLSFEVAGRLIFMRRGETIHTENSHKYTPRSASLLLEAGGWTPRWEWTDEEQNFLLILAEAVPPATMP